MAIKSSEANVRDYGAKGNGTTDDSAAFKAAIDALVSSVATEWSADSAPRITLYVPAGEYLIVTPQSLMASTSASVSINGLHIRGDGRYASHIVYKPTTTGTYLMYNNDKFMFFEISDISFASNSQSNNFLFTYANNKAQNYIFHRCQWMGGWGDVFHFEGGNMGSEMTWFGCGFQDSFANVLNVTAAANDQFVNYNFFGCHFEAGKGDFIHLEKGGSVGVFGGSMIYYGTDSLNSSLFYLGSSSHNYGATRILVEGVRIELRNPTARIVTSYWNFGNITFNSVDAGSQSDHSANDVVNSIFNNGNDTGCIVSWNDCMLIGKHQYTFGGNAFTHQGKASYRNCTMMNHSGASDFLVITNVDGFNNGGQPVVHMENCRGGGGEKFLMDADYGWHNNNRAQVTKKILKIAGADGNLPSASGKEEVSLPLNALITNITCYVAQGATSSTAAGWVYTVKTSEGTPTTLATITPTGNNPSSGINTATNAYFMCDSDVKRHLVLAANATVNNVKGYLMIEYIG